MLNLVIFYNNSSLKFLLSFLAIFNLAKKLNKYKMFCQSRILIAVRRVKVYQDLKL